MAHEIDYLYKGNLSLNEPVAQVKLVFPGVRGEVRKAITVDNVTLAPGTKVIIQPLNRNKPLETPRFKLTVFERVASGQKDLPESKREIRTRASHEVELKKPHRYLSYNEEQYQKTDGCLFKNGSPNMDEINQYRVPNCFFLAALSVIVNHPNGAAYIRSMMRQNDDGTTTVRLYNPKTLEPIYVRVENSFIVDKKGNLNEHQALWAHILEKAYASIPEVLDKNDASMSSVYNKGGNASKALKVLLGINVDDTQIKKGNTAWNLHEFFHEAVRQLKPMLELESQKPGSLPHIQKTVKETLEKQLKIFKIIFDGDSQHMCLALFNFYVKHQSELDKIINIQTEEDMDKLASVKTFINSKIHEAYNDADVPDFDLIIELTEVEEIVDKLFSYYFQPVNNNPNLIRGDRKIFSCKYSPEDLRHYQTIKQALLANKLVTAKTFNNIKNEAGVRANHAYSVLNVYEKKVAVNGEGRMETAYFVRLRNPWGQTGRVYLRDMDTLKMNVIESREAGVFDLELKDFCKYYQKYSVTASVDSLFLIAKQREDLTEEVANILNNWTITKSSTHIDLLEAIDKYDAAVQKLMNLELSQLKRLDSKTQLTIDTIFMDAGLTDIEKQQKIKALINVANFPHIAGNESNVKDYVYNLLQYRHHQQQETLTSELINKCRQQVVNVAQVNDPMWLAMRKNYEHLYIVVTENTKSTLPNIVAGGKQLIERLNKLRAEIPENGGMRKHYLQLYFINHQKLINYVKGLFEYKRLLERLRLKNYQGEFQQMNQMLNQLAEDTEKLLLSEDAKAVNQELLRHNSTEGNWCLNSKELQELNAKLELLGLEAKRYEPVNPTEIEEKTQFFKFFDHIKKIFSSIGQWFKQLFTSRDYERPADDSVTQQFATCPSYRRAGLFRPVVDEKPTTGPKMGLDH